MTEGVIVALIGLAGSIVVHMLVARETRDKLLQSFHEQSRQADAEFDKKLAVYAATTDAKIDELCREVREHNNFARRVPVIEEQIKVANHRIDDLEKIRA